MHPVNNPVEVMSMLAAMATARLNDDADGEGYLARQVPAGHVIYFAQAAVVMLADLLSQGFDLSGSPRPQPALLDAARFMASGGSDQAFTRLAREKPLSLESVVDAVVNAWVQAFGGVNDAREHGCQACSAYQTLLRK